MLLDDIIAILSDSNGSLTDALLKTKVLLHQIGKKDLVPWVSFELGGYPNFDNLPPYRIVSCVPHASLMSAVWTLNDYRLSTSSLKDEDRKNITQAYIDLSISSLEEAGRKSGGGFQRPLDPALAYLFKNVLEPGVHIVSMWCVISPTHIESILAQVRSRLLDFCLELQDVVGVDAEPKVLVEKAATVDTEKMFNMAIYNSGTMIVSGSTNIQINNQQGDIEGLLKEIAKLGYDKDELEELRRAVIEDKNKGEKPNITDGETSKWYLKALKKVGKGVVDGGIDVVSKVISESLKNYSGH
jgi:hypothetical protein